MSIPADDEDLASDIVGTNIYEASLPTKTGFLPWHRPRKQFVRQKQWAKQIEALLDDFSPEGQVLRYLGLPGVDLLDLRHFHAAVCEPRSLQLRFLGFDSPANTGSTSQVELNISLDEVRKLPFVDPRSDVMPDNICSVAKEESIVFRETQKMGPFDVINLDICNGFGSDAPGGANDTHYNALAQLLSLQVRNKNPWLLLLTTRVGREHIHADVLTKLLDKCTQNFTDCQEFREAANKAFSTPDEAAFKSQLDTPGGLLIVFLTGICKWLLSLAVSNNPQAKMEVKSILGYKVDFGAICEDIVSVAFRFDPITAPMIDPLRLANQPVMTIRECPLSAKIVNRVANRKNVDEILAADEILRQEITESMAALLEIARYDKQEYYRWLNEAGGSSQA